MIIQSVSSYSFMYNSQNYNSSNFGENSTTANGNRGSGSSNHYYDILDLSDIDLGDDKTLDAGDIEMALQTEKSQLKRNIHAAMKSAVLNTPKISTKGFDSPFLKHSPNEFISRAAKIFAAYINPEMSGGDEKVFVYAGNDFEAAFNEYAKDESTKYARELANFFSENSPVTDEQVNRLVDEITQVIKEYGTKMAAGQEININDLTTKLHINGVGITIGELNKAVSTINGINSPVFVLDRHADFAAAGLGVAKMKAFTSNSFSAPVAEMLMKTYNNKVTEEISEKDTEIARSKKTTQKNTFIDRYLKGDSPEIKSKKIDNSSVDPYFKLDSKFKGSAKEDIFNLFSDIDTKNIDKSKEDYGKAFVLFKGIMTKWEYQRGYGLASRDKLSNQLRISAAFDGLDEYISLGEEEVGS